MKPIKKKLCAAEGCEKKFVQFRSTDVCCSYICQLKYMDEKAQVKRHKECEVAVKKTSINKELETQINTIVRLIDRGHECITSNIEFGKYKVAAGHYYSVGSNATLRWNLLNIFAQSFSDNDRKGGKGSNYALRLREIFGFNVRDEIESLPSKYNEIKLSYNDKVDALIKAKEIVKLLKGKEVKFTTSERIELRREFNNQIGIYK